MPTLTPNALIVELPLSPARVGKAKTSRWAAANALAWSSGSSPAAWIFAARLRSASRLSQHADMRRMVSGARFFMLSWPRCCASQSPPALRSADRSDAPVRQVVLA